MERTTTRPVGAENRTSDALSLFAEVVVVGVLLVAGSLLLVTAVPSLAAGVAHLRRQATGRDVSFARAVRCWCSAMRTLWPLGLAAAGVALLLALDWWAAAAGVVPGAPAVAVAVAAVATLTLVALARTAGYWAMWTEGGLSARHDQATTPDARDALRAGIERARNDPGGSALLVAAASLCVLFVWMLPALALVVGGLFALAILGVESRAMRGER